MIDAMYLKMFEKTQDEKVSFLRILERMIHRKITYKRRNNDVSENSWWMNILSERKDINTQWIPKFRGAIEYSEPL